MPASYATAHAEPKEHRADRSQLLHTIAYSDLGTPQLHKSTSDSCYMAHTSKLHTYGDTVSPLSQTLSMGSRMANHYEMGAQVPDIVQETEL